MVARARHLQERVLPHGWLDALRQVTLFGLAYLGYRLVRGVVEGNANEAFSHARDLISLERGMHLFVEPSWIYVNAQTSVTIGALLYLYLKHNKNFYFVRNMFLIAMAIALVGYVVFPTAPPRFMPEWGFIDSVSDFTGVKVGQGSASISALTNVYAAVPSMHVAFAGMIGWTLARLVRTPVARVLWTIYPFMMAFVIIVTANHFILDALLGAMTAGASAYGASWLARVRPTVWRFSTVTPPLTASG